MPEVISNGVLHAGPAEAIEAIAEFWRTLWNRDDHMQADTVRDLMDLREEAIQQDPMGTITADMVRAAIGTIPAKAATGMDLWDAGLLRQLPQEGMKALADLLMAIEADALWPPVVWAVAVALMAKPTGGQRPIALVAMTVKKAETLANRKQANHCKRSGISCEM